MTNPYADQLGHLPAYGRYHPKVPGYLAEVSLDPDEVILSSIKCNHGQYQVGYLAITTERLRFFRRLVLRGHDYWPLETTMTLAHGLPPVIELADGSLFQCRGLRPGPIKEFVSLHQVLVEAMIWDERHAALSPTVTNGGDVTLAEELASLDRFRQQGMLSEAEFTAAKARLLGLGS